MLKQKIAPAFWIGFFLFAVYLLSFSGRLHVMDELFNFAVGNNLVQHGRPDVNQLIWANHWHEPPPGIWGHDGNLYTKKAPGISLAVAPLIWLGHTVPGLNAIQTGLLLSTLATALTGGLLFIWLLDLNFSRRVALLTALAYGLSTIAWAYARLLWEHSLVALTVLVAAWALYRAVHQAPETGRRWPWALLCSLAAAGALLLRFELALVVAVLGLYLFLGAAPLPSSFSPSAVGQLLLSKRRWLWATGYAVLPLLAGLGLLYFNLIRYGSLTETGYSQEILFQRPWEGAFGLLFSPGKGLFLYAPLMLLLFAGLRPAWRRLPRPYVVTLLGLAIFYWIFYGSWFSWGSTWVWGPRFLLHTLPLLMLFVAETLAGAVRLTEEARWPVRLGVWGAIGLLALAGVGINILGVAVDLNEHFLRLGRNDNFVFNWAASPPLGHWRILQEGLVDLSWLRPQPGGPELLWPVFGPLAALFGLACAGLVVLLGVILPHKQRRFWARAWDIASRPALMLLAGLIAASLTCLLLLATGYLALLEPQAQADLAVLEKLEAAKPGDALHIPMPPFGDVQEVATYMMGFLDEPLPTYAWIESEPRAIQPVERERIWQATQAQAEWVWLFERWLTPKDPLNPTAARYQQLAFPVGGEWLAQSGKLSLYALPPAEPPALSLPFQAPFAGGVTLTQFDLFNPVVRPGQILKVRLTWQAQPFDMLASTGVPDQQLITFVHLVDEASGQNVAQQDRLLLDLARPEQSPLRPGQTAPQGYGLALPDDLPPGQYPLIIGLYHAASGQRLVRADSPDDFLYLTTVTVTP